MTKNAENFVNVLACSKELSEKFKECKEPAEVVKLAAQYDIPLTEEDLDFSEETKELDPDELDAVAGGKACVCVMGGGGEATRGGQKVCACVGSGLGYVDYKCGYPGFATEEGKGWGWQRCICVFGGGGKDDDIDDASKKWLDNFFKNHPDWKYG